MFLCVAGCVSRRLELPDGLGIPVSQLARLRLGVRLPLRGRHRRPQCHARESPLLPGGLQLLPTTPNNPVVTSRISSLCVRSLNYFAHTAEEETWGSFLSSQNGKHDEGWMILKQVHDTNMRAKGYPERVFSVSDSDSTSFSLYKVLCRSSKERQIWKKRIGFEEEEDKPS